MAKPNKIIPLAGAGGDSSFVLKVWLAIWRSSSVLGQKFGGFSTSQTLRFWVLNQTDTIFTRVSALAKTWATCKIATKSRLKSLVFVVWFLVTGGYNERNTKRQFCQFAICQVAFFVHFRSYLQIVQVLTKTKALVIIVSVWLRTYNLSLRSWKKHKFLTLFIWRAIKWKHVVMLWFRQGCSVVAPWFSIDGAAEALEFGTLPEKWIAKVIFC